MIRRVSPLKKALGSLIVVGSMSFLTVAGTFAIMSSDTANRQSSIASGTLTFSNTVGAGTACFSYNGPLNANPSCDALFSASTLMYPGTLATAKVTIANNGSLNPSSLYVYMPSCSMQTTPGAPPGGANPCGLNGAQFYLQETNSSWTPLASCLYPPSANTSCTAVASTLYGFSTTYTSSAAPLNLGSGPTIGNKRYFIVGMQLPSNASNSLQGEEALFSLTWGFAQ